MSKEKPLCLWCKHFRFDSGELGWSDWTPGSDFEMACGMHQFTFSVGDRRDLREVLLTARTCPMYEFNEECREMVKEGS